MAFRIVVKMEHDGSWKFIPFENLEIGDIFILYDRFPDKPLWQEFKVGGTEITPIMFKSELLLATSLPYRMPGDYAGPENWGIVSLNIVYNAKDHPSIPIAFSRSAIYSTDRAISEDVFEDFKRRIIDGYTTSAEWQNFLNHVF